MHDFLLKSQILIVLSSLPVAKWYPFSLKEEQISYLTCPKIGKTDLPVLKSQTIPAPPRSPVNF